MGATAEGSEARRGDGRGLQDGHAHGARAVGLGSDTNEGFWKATGDHGPAASMASSRLDQTLGTNMLSHDIEAEHETTETDP